MGSDLQKLISLSTAFKSYGVKQDHKSQLLMCIASPRPVFATLLTVEASEATERLMYECSESVIDCEPQLWIIRMCLHSSHMRV